MRVLRRLAEIVSRVKWSNRSVASVLYEKLLRSGGTFRL